MAGVFSGGVLTRLEELDFYDRIQAIYAGSVGAMNASYFLSRQTKLGASIYFDDLPHNFVLPYNIPIGILKLIWRKYIRRIPRDDTSYSINIDHVIDLISNKKPIIQDKVKNQEIDFYIKVLNTRTGRVVYVDTKNHNLISVLRASSCCAPHYPFSENIDGDECIDGTIAEPIGLQYLLDLYPEHKIVVVVNNFLKRKFSHSLRCFAEGIVGQLCDYPLFRAYVGREPSLRHDLKLALSNPRVLLICPPEGCPAIAMTTDRDKLIKAFEVGKQMANKIGDFYSNT